MAVEKPEIWAEILGMDFFGILRITGRNAPKIRIRNFASNFALFDFEFRIVRSAKNPHGNDVASDVFLDCSCCCYAMTEAGSKRSM